LRAARETNKNKKKKKRKQLTCADRPYAPTSPVPIRARASPHTTSAWAASTRPPRRPPFRPDARDPGGRREQNFAEVGPAGGEGRRCAGHLATLTPTELDLLQRNTSTYS